MSTAPIPVAKPGKPLHGPGVEVERFDLSALDPDPSLAPAERAESFRDPEGVLWLNIDANGRGGKSRAASQYFRRGLRVMRPHYLDDSGQVAYTVLSVGGGYLGNDVFDQRFHVQEDASFLLTSQGSTKIYRTPQGPVEQHTQIQVEEGGVLEYLMEPTIAYRDSDYRQYTDIAAHPYATVVISEGLTPGWHPDGKLFKYNSMRMRTSVTDVTNGKLFLLDNMLLEPKNVNGEFGWMEGYTHAGQLLVMDRRVDQDLVNEVNAKVKDVPGMYGAANLMTSPGTQLRGFMLRSLSESTQVMLGVHEDIASELRGRWRGQGRINLRKY